MTGVYIGIGCFTVMTLLLLRALVWPADRFRLMIENGRVVRTMGDVPETFITDVERICALWGITAGTIRGVPVGTTRIRIQVSGDIPQEHARAFQNAWDHPM